MNLGQKWRKVARMIQCINAQPNTRINRAHLTATHEEKHSNKQGDRSSIYGNIFSTNQARLQGSMGPPDLNRLKTRSRTHICHLGPWEDRTAKGEAEWARPMIGATDLPLESEASLMLPQVGSRCDSAISPCEVPLFPHYKYEGRG